MSSEQKLLNVLIEYNLDYSEYGANIGSKCIGLQCPRCLDNAYHAAVFRETPHTCTCWRCGYGISLSQFIYESQGGNLTDIKTKVKFLLYGRKAIQKPVEEVLKPAVIEKDVQLPSGILPIAEAKSSLLVASFCKTREMGVEMFIERDFYVCFSGNYEGRLIIPIIHKGKLISYQSRDMTGLSHLRYKTCPDTKLNNTLFNIDSIKDIMIITEGVFDALRVGKEAVATFGTSITEHQLQLILELNPARVVFAWDSDAYLKARKAAKQLKPFLERVDVIKFPRGLDPDEYGIKYGTKKLRELLGI